MTIIAVSGMVRESRIAAGPGVRTLAGSAAGSLRRKLEQAIAEGADGIISIGIAGGLAPWLKSGDCVIGSQVLADGARFNTDALWTERIIARLTHASLAPVVSVNAVAATVAAKAALFHDTQAHAVDMESHIVALSAREHHLPFAVVRTIVDPATIALPPLASVAVNDRGRVNLMAVLVSLLGDPRQILMVSRTARASRIAFEELLRCRRALGVRLAGPDASKLDLDMA